MFDGIVEQHELELTADGQAFACFSGERSSGGSISHYASHDGKDHDTRHEEDWTFGMRGSWKKVGGLRDGVEVTFESIRYSDCSRVEEAVALAPAQQWVCKAMKGVRDVPDSVLACALESQLAPRDIERAALVIEGGERDGSWALRDDPTGRGPSIFDDTVHPWLLMGEVVGERGGLEIRSTDDGEGRGRDGVDLAIRPETVGPIRPIVPDPVP